MLFTFTVLIKQSITEEETDFSFKSKHKPNNKS